MAEWINLFLITGAALLLLPVAVFCVECLAALLPGRRQPPAANGPAQPPRPSLAVLIPAHNEQAVLGATLQSLAPQLNPGDRLVVVADNCTDGTAEVARAHGAQVTCREDAERRGKGYALDHGVRYLSGDPRDVVIVVDADCRTHAGALDALARQAAATARPAQAAYLLEAPDAPAAASGDAPAAAPGRGAPGGIPVLAFMVKNVARPAGLRRLGLPCLLTGAGMAFPWAVISRASLASGNIVEDLQLGLDLAAAGHAPAFCPAARFTSRLPDQPHQRATQRRRWEHGHLRTLLTQGPRMVAAAVRRRDLRLLALALELCVPPLSLLLLLVLAAASCALAAAAAGASAVPLWMLLGGAACMLACVLASCVRHSDAGARGPLLALASAPLYVGGKLPLYVSFLLKPQREWVATRVAPGAKPATAPATTPLTPVPPRQSAPDAPPDNASSDAAGRAPDGDALDEPVPAAAGGA